jgi:hypothetical protein
LRAKKPSFSLNSLPRIKEFLISGLIRYYVSLKIYLIYLKKYERCKRTACQAPKKARGPFFREWLADFSAFMQFMQTNSFNIQILEALKREREEAYASLTCTLKKLFEDGKKCLEEIEDRMGGRSIILVTKFPIF